MLINVTWTPLIRDAISCSATYDNRAAQAAELWAQSMYSCKTLLGLQIDSLSAIVIQHMIRDKVACTRSTRSIVGHYKAQGSALRFACSKFSENGDVSCRGICRGPGNNDLPASGEGFAHPTVDHREGVNDMPKGYLREFAKQNFLNPFLTDPCRSLKYHSPLSCFFPGACSRRSVVFTTLITYMTISAWLPRLP